VPHRPGVRGGPDLCRTPSPVICSRIWGSVAAQIEALRASGLAPKLRRETVDLHLGVLVFGVRSDCTFNDLAHRSH
jgi:hypothetical protein